MGLLSHKNFSDAVTGANGFDSINASNGTIEQSAGAGLNGTSGGVTCTRTANSPSLYGRLDHDLTGKSVLRAAWYTDLSSLTIGTNGHATVLFSSLALPSGDPAMHVGVLRSSGSLILRSYLYNDSGGLSFETVPLVSMDWMEVRVQRSSAGATADGSLTLYAGGGSYAELGELVMTIPGIVHYTRFEVQRFIGGMYAFFTSTSVGGSIKFDELSVRDDDTPILFGVSASTFSPILTYLRRRRRD